MPQGILPLIPRDATQINGLVSVWRDDVRCPRCWQILDEPGNWIGRSPLHWWTCACLSWTVDPIAASICIPGAIVLEGYHRLLGQWCGWPALFCDRKRDRSRDCWTLWGAILFRGCLKKFPINPVGSNYMRTLACTDLSWFSTGKATARRFFTKCVANIALPALLIISIRTNHGRNNGSPSMKWQCRAARS